MPSTTVAAVLEEAAACVREGLAETHTLQFRIGQAVETYVAGVETKQAIVLAQRLGLPCAPAPDTRSMARTLLEVVCQIPELRDTGAGLPTEQAPALAPAADAEADALCREALELGDMEELFDDHFRQVAEELAARARMVQERLGDRGRDSPETRVIRKLTYLASQRDIRDIHGLKRHHTGNWCEQARLARRERDRLEKGAKTASRRTASATAGPEPLEDEPLPLPRLAADGRAVAIVGGEVDTQKLVRLRAKTGALIEWVGNEGVARLETRIREGRISAVVVLEGLVSHSGIEPIVCRARDSAVPLEYGGKAGLASIRAALVRLEARVGAVAA